MELFKSKENTEALQYLRGNSAHSDTVEALFLACSNLDGVERQYDSKSIPFSACYLAKNGEIFALVRGMQYITLRLSISSAEELIRKGGSRNRFFTTNHWIDVSPFKEGINLEEWVNKAFFNQ